MAENSAIQWTTHTFNPWWGCTKVGPGCDHCYAESFDKRVGGAHWGSSAPRRLVKDWSGPRKWNRDAERTGERPWVFCASMADVFDNEVPAEWRARLWDLVRECQHLRWQFVTKRIGNAAKMLPPDWEWNFEHCGILITVVNQDEANRDIWKLIQIPAAWRGLSMEPLLGPVDLTKLHLGQAKHLDDGSPAGHVYLDGLKRNDAFPSIDWVIVGGESGPRARLTHPQWIISLRDQCRAAGVPFFFKQWGEWVTRQHACAIGRSDATAQVVDGPFPTIMCRVGTKAAGRLLDGVEHNGMPEVRHG